MFIVPHSRIENLGLFKADNFETSTTRDIPIYITPHFIKNGKELTIEDDIKILMNGGTPYSGFLTAEQLATNQYKCVGWHYINLKHIKTMYSSSQFGQLIFNRVPNEINGAFLQNSILINTNNAAWNIPLYLFIKDDKLNKVFFTPAYKICEGKNKLYQIYLNNSSYGAYAKYIYRFISQLTFPENIYKYSENDCYSIGVFQNNGKEYLFSNNTNTVVELPIDLNNVIAYTSYMNIPNFNKDEYNKTKKVLSEDANNYQRKFNNSIVLFHWGKELMPKELEEKIVGVTPEKGLPLFNYKDLFEAGFVIEVLNNQDNNITKELVEKYYTGIRTKFSILDIPFAVLKFRKYHTTYSYATPNNLYPTDGGNNTDKYFLNFSEFMYKHPITGQIYSLYGYKGESRSLVLNKEIDGVISKDSQNDDLYASNIILKPSIINGDYGISIVIANNNITNQRLKYDTKRTTLNYIPSNAWVWNGLTAFNESVECNGNKVVLAAKDAEVYRTPKSMNYIYKDNPHLKTQNKIALNLDGQYPDNFVIFDRVPKNIIDNNNEWDETKDTRDSFDCDGFRDIEVFKWLSHIPTQINHNFDTTYQFNKEIRDIEKTNQLVDLKLKYISNQLVNCKIYLVDTKYFNVIGQSEWYKTLLPFRCIFFPINDMWLYTADNKIDKLNPKYFGENNEFIYDIQQFTKFCVKHYSKVFEVIWDTKKANNTDFKITEGTTIKYTFCNAPIDYYATIYAPYTNGIISLYNLELNTEMK